MLHFLKYGGVDVNYPWVEVDSGQTGYLRERWCSYWRQFVKHFFDTDINYAFSGSKVYWIIPDRELNKTMTDIWSLEREGYRTSYQSKIRTFFWVDSEFYRQNRKEIIQWGERYGCKMPSHEYGWIEMPDDKIEMLFRLRWAGKSYG
jgi:hypothetical protein